ncbi:MAG: transposase, partial [Myxococcales bacterium]|nr:transposase [Myxococcales bacterium]
HHVRVARAAGHVLGPESYAHPGAVNFLQKFGSALQVNPHFHALVIDGVYVTERPGAVPTFHPAPPLTDLDVARVQADAQARIERVLRARGLLARDGADPELLEGYEDSALPGLWSASLLSQTVAGDNSTKKVPRLVEREGASAKREALELPRGALVASANGYSLHAATRIEADDRDALERLIRYMARPPLAQGRLMLREDGKVLWNLRRPWRDGTRGFVFDPLTFIGRLAALVPHVREHQLTYHGCLAPASPLRDHVVLRPPSSRPSRCEAAGAAPNQPSGGPKFSWADLMMRVWSKDVLRCPRCGSRRVMLAAISDGPTIARLLAHLGLPTEPLPVAPAREPPQLDFAW